VARLDTCSSQINDFQIDIAGIAETNVSWTEPRRLHAQQILKRHARQAHMAVSSSNDVGCNEYLPGGIASCVVGKWTGRIVETITDKSGLGRWAGHILTSRNNTHTVVITAYRPVKAPGFLTTYQQQWRMLRRQNNPDPDPRQQLLDDLERQMTQWRAKSYEIILMWDANEGIKLE
jgi:hypothetical protein